jgi:hypothetical protein
MHLAVADDFISETHLWIREDEILWPEKAPSAAARELRPGSSVPALQTAGFGAYCLQNP